MITVQNDWVTYETVPVRPTAVRGGSACTQRTPVVTARRPAAPVGPLQAPRGGAAPRPAPAPARRARTAPAAPKPRLRLTRRGRLALVVLPAAVGVAAALVSVTAPLAQAQPTRSDRTVVVGTGDTLWSIAERVAPSSDPRDVVAVLEHANHLSSATIQAGQRLVLPAAMAG